MKQLTLIVKPFRAEAVLADIAEAGLDDCVVREAKGFGRQKQDLARYRGSEFSMAFLAKVEITVWVPDRGCEDLCERLAKIARTGRIGDGKVMVVPAVMDAIEF